MAKHGGNGDAGQQEPSIEQRLLRSPFPSFPAPIFLFAVLITYLLVSSIPQATLTVVLFASFRTLAVPLIVFPTTLREDVYGLPENVPEEDIEDREEDLQILQVDSACYGMAVLVAGILVPDGWWNVAIWSVLSFLLTVAARPLLRDITEEEQLDKDDKLLNRWDEKFFHSQQQEDDED